MTKVVAYHEAKYSFNANAFRPDESFYEQNSNV